MGFFLVSDGNKQQKNHRKPLEKKTPQIQIYIHTTTTTKTVYKTMVEKANDAEPNRFGVFFFSWIFFFCAQFSRVLWPLLLLLVGYIYFFLFFKISPGVARIIFFCFCVCVSKVRADK